MQLNARFRGRQFSEFIIQKARSLRRLIALADWQQSWHGLPSICTLMCRVVFREDRPTFMIMSCHTNAMQKGNVIQTKTLTLYTITPRGFRRQASPRPGGEGGNLDAPRTFHLYPLSRRPSTCQRFPAAGPGDIKREWLSLSVVDLQK